MFVKSHVRLFQLIPYLQEQLKSPHFLVRSITCWTISRYSSWIVYKVRIFWPKKVTSTIKVQVFQLIFHVQENVRTMFEPILEALLESALDRSKAIATAESFRLSIELTRRIVLRVIVCSRGRYVGFCHFGGRFEAWLGGLSSPHHQHVCESVFYVSGNREARQICDYYLHDGLFCLLYILFLHFVTVSQAKNLVILLDAIATLADGVKSVLAKP